LQSNLDLNAVFVEQTHFLANRYALNVKDQKGQTALMAAAYRGHTDCMKVLLDKGANVNIIDKAGKTALMYAREKNHTEIIEVLKQYGAKK